MAGRYWDEELETAPWPEVEAWQAGRVAEFVDGLRARSAFHKDRLDSAARPHGSPASLRFLADFPFTTKEDIRRSQEEQAPGEPLGRHQGVPLDAIVQVVSSSGTTGNPMFYGVTAADLELWRQAIAGVFFTCGIRAADVVGHLVGLPGVAGGLPYADGFRAVGATLAWLGGFPTDRILASIPRLQVTALLSTASFGTYLTDHCAELTGAPAAALGVRKLLGGGEPGFGQPEIREKIRAGWELTHLREMMGLADVLPALWAECDDESGMHFCAQRAVAVELIHPAGGEPIPWEEGAGGEAVYTTFAREATPALRYRSSDHVAVTGAGRCACGRTSPRIRCVGRTDDMLIYKGMNVFPSAIRDVALSCGGDAVEPYLRVWKERADQVRFDDPIPVEVEAAEGLPAERYPQVAARIEAELRARLQVRASVTVVAPGTFPQGAYKTPLVHVRPQPGRETT
ncbi:MAG: phenylacetate--CoA ligase family protein [Acidimicrobiia bacterium]